MKEKITVRSSLKDISNFTNIPTVRKGVIDSAPDTPLGKNYAVNSTANFLHPTVQNLVVKRVIQTGKDVKSYVLEPDTSLGTAKLAYFRPGQYISVALHIGAAVVTRPYTICSSPLLSVDDEYIITVKKVPHGFASSFIYDTWQKGTKVEASAPEGTLFYQQLRDCKNIVAIADGNGSSGFLSMARAVADGTIDCDITLLYGCRKKNEAILMDEFNEVAEKCDKFKVIYIFSDERVDKCERGFITKNIIEKYAPPSRYSVFICGSNTLYNLVSTQLAEMRFERKFVRFGLSGQIQNPGALPDFPKSAVGKTFLCKVIKNGEPVATIPCCAEESVLVSLEREGIEAPSSCRSGECGFCRAKLIKGNVFIPHGADARRAADAKYGIIHPCCSYPMSDLTLVIN